jgi:hypothetical protein
MNINFQNISSDLIVILESIFQKNKPAVVSAVNQYISDSKDRITHLAEGAASGELAYSFVVERLKEEAVNIKDYLLSIGEIILSDVQQIVNDTVDIFQKALNEAIGVYR